MTRAFLLALLALVAAGAEAGGAGASRDTPPRLLVIGVDAVPWSVAAAVANPALGERALFRGLRGPTAVVSSFPSTSYPAWSSLLKPLGVPPSPGYTGKYYAEHKDRVVGGAAGGGEPAWLAHFDWHLEGLLAKAVAYGNARRASANELEEALAAFAASDEPVYWLYILTTDALAHEYGPAALVDFLASLDAGLARLRAAMPERPFHTAIVSDHGMEGGADLVNAWPDVRAAMEHHGFRDARRLAEPGDAIFVPLGILSFFFVHTRAEDAAPAASVLARVEDVDLCVRADRDAWMVAGPEGEARIGRRVDARGMYWSYTPVTGDPLGYANVVAALRARTGDAGAAWFPDAAWFEATANGRYPDALHRLAGAFEDGTHPATLLCSLESGYMFAARGPEILARSVIGAARWTHGALTRDATLGMLMSDVPGWTAPAAVRAESALELLLPVSATKEAAER